MMKTIIWLLSLESISSSGGVGRGEYKYVCVTQIVGNDGKDEGGGGGEPNHITT